MSPPSTGPIRVVLLGTDPTDPRGGIGVAMRGFRQVLADEGLLYAFHPTYDPLVWGRSWRRAAGALRPMLRSVRAIRAEGGTPVVYSHAGGPVSILREGAMLRVARRAGARTLLQLHSVHVADLLERRVGRAALRGALGAADRLAALSPYWRDLLQTHGFGPVSVVPNPLPPWAEERARRPLPDRPTGPLEVLCMTRLVPGKGVDLAIRAMAHGPAGARLTIAGDGPERARLEALAAGHRVDFAGWVEGEAKDRLLRRSHVYLLPTRYDATGMGFLEAAAYGIPSIALRFRAIPDVVEHGRTGLLVDRPDPVALGAALAELADPARRSAMAVQAVDRVLERFSRAAVGRALRAALRPGR